MKLRPAWRAWYAWMSLLLFIAGQGLMVLGGYLMGEAWIIELKGGASPYGIVGRATIGLGVIAFITAAIWTFFITPWIQSGDRRLHVKDEPKKYGPSMTLLPMMPVVFLMVLGLVLSVVLPIIDRVTGVRNVGAAEKWIGLAMLAAAAFILWPTYRFSKRIDRRFRHLIRQRNICFDCGYDLRMTTSDTCPECGVEIPQINANMRNAATVSTHESTS